MESNLRCDGSHDQEHAALRVLVVEDHEDTAQSTSMLLALYGYEVHLAPDGPSALQAARSTHPDVVLLDLGLPKMDGWQVAKQLREQVNCKRPFLIAVTGYGRQIDHERSHEAGIDLHLVKPVDPEMLQDLLRRFQTVITPAAESQILSAAQTKRSAARSFSFRSCPKNTVPHDRHLARVFTALTRGVARRTHR
jgi:CheY-like chemotaxis protein